jgi:hypothetical protein
MCCVSTPVFTVFSSWGGGREALCIIGYQPNPPSMYQPYHASPFWVTIVNCFLFYLIIDRIMTSFLEANDLLPGPASWDRLHNCLGRWSQLQFHD